MIPLPDIVTLRNTNGRKVDMLCEAKTIVIGRGDAGRHTKTAKKYTNLQPTLYVWLLIALLAENCSS